MLCAALIATAACNNDITGLEPPSDPAADTFAPSLGVNVSNMSKTSSGLYFQDVVFGTGAEVTSATDSVRVTYAGYLIDGKLFDSGTNTTFQPALLIQGFREGMIGMKEGGIRKLVIPSALGYANVTQRDLEGRISIPRQSTLVFDVEVRTVHNPPPPETP